MNYLLENLTAQLTKARVLVCSGDNLIADTNFEMLPEVLKAYDVIRQVHPIVKFEDYYIIRLYAENIPIDDAASLMHHPILFSIIPGSPYEPHYMFESIINTYQNLYSEKI